MTCSKWLAAVVLVGLAIGLLVVPKAPVVPVEPIINIVIKVEHPLNGSVLFWEDGFLVKPILRNTDSHLTHAAIILDGYVYEAVPPAVHKVLLKDYRKEMSEKKRKDFKYFIMEPKKPYSKSELAAMRKYLDSQLGRRYMMRGYWKEKETRGIFCSQLVGNTIETTGRIKSANFHESPGSLYKKLESLYERIK
jgi:hypothetical protein